MWVYMLRMLNEYQGKYVGHRYIKEKEVTKRILRCKKSRLKNWTDSVGSEFYTHYSALDVAERIAIIGYGSN